MNSLTASLLAIHVLSAVVWVGGMFYALVVLRPALSVLDAAPRLQLHMLTLKRFFLVVWHAMPLMLLTGWGMIIAAGWDMGHLPLYVNAMQGLGLVMAGIFLFTYFVPFRRLRRAIRRPRTARPHPHARQHQPYSRCAGDPDRNFREGHVGSSTFG